MRIENGRGTLSALNATGTPTQLALTTDAVGHAEALWDPQGSTTDTQLSSFYPLVGGGVFATTTLHFAPSPPPATQWSGTVDCHPFGQVGNDTQSHDRPQSPRARLRQDERRYLDYGDALSHQQQRRHHRGPRLGGRNLRPLDGPGSGGEPADPGGLGCAILVTEVSTQRAHVDFSDIQARADIEVLANGTANLRFATAASGYFSFVASPVGTHVGTASWSLEDKLISKVGPYPGGDRRPGVTATLRSRNYQGGVTSTPSIGSTRT